MLNIYRRHVKTCLHRSEGARYLKCSCPIWVIGEINGKTIRRTLKTRDMQRAIRLAERIERPSVERFDLLPCAQLGCNERVERGRCSQHQRGIADAIGAFHAAKADLSEGTKRNNRRALRVFQEHVGDVAVHEIQAEKIDAFRSVRGISANTWTKELQILRNFFKFCVQRKWTSENPAVVVLMPKNVKPTDKEPYNPNEIVKILAACDTFGQQAYERLRARAMVLLFRHTALRISDVATFSRDRIRNGEVYLRTLKNGKVVKLPLHPELKKALDVVPLPRGATGACRYYFWSGNGTTRALTRDITRTMKAVFKESAVPQAHSHRFRHTLATEILGVPGGTFEDVADVLGISPSIARKHYAKWSRQRQDRVSKVMQSVFGSSPRTTDVHEKSESANNVESVGWIGGRHGIRTHDPGVANAVLSQLS